MRMPVLLLPFLAISVTADPLILPLNKFSSFGTSLPGADLYLASKDSNEYLKNIQITTGGSSITLDSLNGFNADSSPKRLRIIDTMTVSTTNNNTISSWLGGNLYVTTKAQADDPSFSVYVIKTEHNITMKSGKTTAVILNTKLEPFVYIDQPFKTSYVTGIQQSKDAVVNFKWGIPAYNWQSVDTNNTFFKNPMDLKNDTYTGLMFLMLINNENLSFQPKLKFSRFFDHIEPLQIGFEYWYIMANGSITMQIENKFITDQNYSTTAATTTGLIVNELLFYPHIVTFQPDYTRSGFAGFLVSAFPENELWFTMSYDSSYTTIDFNGTSSIEDRSWAPEQARMLTINSTNQVAGVFYCQYFSYAGDLLPMTSTSSPTTSMRGSTGMTTNTTIVSTTTVGTTTSGACFMSLWVLFVSVVYIIF
ncbi:Protein CBG10444 [Caenorhabditis briggsae]|uniref:Protein CBG10444 n=1 Tax=Caenorhabditis briggsae TaxID=6238 RepID=A8XB83_CAEBR|nr:Protein CBG10444 [Caenorhabditis briggsae]CAP29863.2 Protein CBG10444 [Caenorhabditis briggsae]